MLRESSKFSDEAVEISDVTRGLSSGTEIAHAAILVAYAESVVRRERAHIDAARQAVFDALGNDGTVDAAATIAAFHGFTRIADTIGIPYETAAAGEDVPELRAQTGINAFYRISGEG